MNINEFEKIFKKYLEELNIELNKEQIEKFYKYMMLLIKWNEKINLTTIIEPEEIIVKHFIDCLTISKYIDNDLKLIDIGTGAGFPGIPLKIYREDLEITLVDSLKKRLLFLDDVIENLNLENIVTIHSRAEELGKNLKYREKFDIATSRAVANFSTLSEYLIPFVKINGKCIYMKSTEINEELNNAKNAIKILGGNLKNKDVFKLPKSDIGRSIIIVEKIKETPVKYPRKPGLPAKEPIT